MNVDALADSILAKTAGKQRYIVAIAGAPASGKSTLSEKLMEEINLKSEGRVCSVIPMDGFHLDNGILQKRNQITRKGAPETFDASGFFRLIRRVKSETGDIFYPIFNRDLDLAIAGAGLLSPDHSVVLVEGNYLLCDVPVWRKLRAEFDYCISLDIPFETLEKRLIKRWVDQGYDKTGAKDRALSNDIPNAKFVVEHSGPADIVLN